VKEFHVDVKGTQVWLLCCCPC